MSFCFFSSRRRHTRFDCDWSSDVCSSDLFSCAGNTRVIASDTTNSFAYTKVKTASPPCGRGMPTSGQMSLLQIRLLRGSEERRVGEEGRSRWSPDPLKKKKNTTRDVRSNT